MPITLPLLRARGTSRPIGLAAALTLLAAPLAAQSPAPCADGALPATTDSVRVSIVATVTSRDTGVAELPAEYTSKLVSALAPHFQAPAGPFTVLTTLGAAPTLGGAAPAAGSVLVPALGTRAFIIVRKDGSVAKLDMITQSMSLDIEDAIEAALHAADSAHTLPALPDAIKRDSMPITITLRVAAAADHPAGELTQTTLPKYTGVTLPAAQDAGLKAIAYPKADIPADAVELQFVIDAAGAPLPITFDTEKVSYRESLDAVIDGLPKVKYSPAQVAGCPVSFSVMQTFSFDPKNKDKR